MFVVRPVELNDLDRLLELAGLTSFGLTTLPKDRQLLEKRIKASRRAFENLDDGEPHGESYLFVMEDLTTGLVVGTSGIVSKVGGFEPFYSYRIETSVHDSRILQVRKEIPVLHLEENHDGPCEIGSLFLHPDARNGGVGRTLSLSRFLFMADYPHLFDPDVIAEMRGVIDEQGRSPFWDALGRHFFDLEFPKADYLSIVNKEFIGDLMPRYPIYVPLLPPQAQAVIGQVHELTQPARKLLESEGFEFENQIDIFEGGPMLHCQRNQIRAVKESLVCPCAEIQPSLEGKEIVLMSSRSEGFLATSAPFELTRLGIVIDEQTAQALKISLGDPVRFVSLKAKST